MLPFDLGLTARPRRLIALAAHPDDLEIGCGGTLLRLATEVPGLTVEYVLATGTAERLDEGAQLVPGPGHVTSSYSSAALGRPFALALLARGRDRIGEVVRADRIAAEVVESVLWDREGARRDGRPA